MLFRSRTLWRHPAPARLSPPVPRIPPPRHGHHEHHTLQARHWHLPGRTAPSTPQAQPSPAGHLRSPACQARPPPEREARRCSLTARAGERSHHGGGPISPRPAGSGSRGLWRCRTVDEEAAEAGEEGGPGGPVSPPGSWESAGTAEFPFPRAARPTTLTQTPVTTGGSRWPKPSAS